MTSTPTDGRPDTRDMRIVHAVFRREYALLPHLVRGVEDGDTGRAGTVADHARLVSDLLHIHHTGEDVALWPVLLEQAPEAAAIVHRMQGQHEQLLDLLASTDVELPRWAAAPGRATGEAAATLLEDLRAALVGHLDEEEAEVLPLCERTMSVAQWHALGEHGRSHVPPDRIFLVFGMMLEDAPPEAAALMLSDLPPEVQAAWAEVGKAQYADYVRRVRDGRAGAGT